MRPVVRQTAPVTADRPKRQFWLHQVAEYVVGLALVATGLQSPEPLVPALTGGLVLINVSIVDGPLSAFHVVSRQMHRIMDWVVIGVIGLLAVLPVADAATRVVMVPLAFVLAVVARQTEYRTRAARAPATVGDRSEDVGRAAGRLVGRGVRLARRDGGPTGEPPSDRR
jgi:hypothetical protein